ncbi:MAG: iron chelate uptake ABC transporter family permease subunit [Planctomycetota bacterium]
MLSLIEYNTAVVLAGTTVLGATSGAMGTLALLRRRALLGDALAHATLPGICLAFLWLGRREFAGLLGGALATGLLGVVVVSFLARFTRIKEDAAIGIVLSVFFGAGIVLSGVIQRTGSSGAQAGIDSFILGQTAGMVRSDLQFITIAAALVLIALILLYKEFKLLCFDADFAAVEGWPVLFLDLVLMLLLTVTTVIGLPAVGVALMVALLVIPAATARLWVTRLGPLIFVASAMGAAIGAVGTAISASIANIPTGPIIVLCGSALFIASLMVAPRRGLLARWRAGRAWVRRRREQRWLRGLYDLAEAGSPLTIDRLAIDLHLTRRDAARLVRRGLRQGWLAPAANANQVDLTPAGQTKAARLVRAQRLWSLYLLRHAEIDRDLVDLDVEFVEQVLPAPMVAELESELARSGRLPPSPGAHP